MKRFAETLLRAALMTLLLVGAPLLGLVAAGRPVAPYLEFPPHTRFVTHAPFSWTAFALIGLLGLRLAVCSSGRRCGRTNFTTRRPPHLPLVGLDRHCWRCG
jgi:hypothetical protein